MTGLMFSAICLIWGSTWLAIKFCLDGIPPFLGAGLRFFISSIILWGIVLYRKTPLRLRYEDKICVVSCGFLSFMLNYAGVYWAEQYISSGLTAVLFSTMPLMVVVLSRYWMQSETLTARKISGILLGIAGMAVLFGPQDQVSSKELVAMAVTLFATVSAAVNLVMMKRYSRHSDVYLINAFGMPIGAIGLFSMSLAFESYDRLFWSWANLSALFYLSILGTVIAFSIFYHLVKVVDASALSMVTLIHPIVAVILGHMILDEKMTAMTVLGTATVLAGVGIASFSLAHRQRFVVSYRR